MKTLLIIVNEDQYFVSHRMRVAQAALADGWRVIVGAAPTSGCASQICAAGLEYVELPLYGDGMSAGAQARTLIALVHLFRKHSGAFVHLVGMKMLLIGNLAVRLAGNMGGVVNAVCGMGRMFLNPSRLAPRVLLSMLRGVWQRKNVVTIVQNRDDEALLEEAGVIRPEEVEFIKGSGVNLNAYPVCHAPALTPEGKMRVIFTGRLLRSKGVEDFIRCAEILRPEWEGKAEFMICGGLSTNSDSMTEKEMRDACDGKYLIWAGNRNDVRQLLNESRIMLFPGYYREGVPLSLIEASAAGLPIVTCDSVGCRDTIDGNGVLLPPRSPELLAKEVGALLADPDRCARLGKRSRQIAEHDYSIDDVVSRHLEIYDSLFVSRQVV